ncbi:MAG: phosphoesterase [Terriglobales bacterium]
MKVRVFFHDRCFDGAASAALFSRFYRERVRPDSDFLFTGLVHRAGALFDEHLFDGEENAIVDFKYSASPQVTWWFDHHQSAFLTPEDQEHFHKSRDPRRFFFDPDYKSCTKFIADVAQRQFGFDATPVAELVRWADIIDGAQYPDAKSAVEMKAAAPRLTMIIEASQDDSLMPRLIPLLAERPLAEILEQPFVAPLLAPLLARHENSIELLRQRTECRDGTVFFDVTDQDLEGHNKFVPYYLHPNCTYSVGLSKSSFRTKVSVGSNPWSPAGKMVNLAVICERYGGGGHARVGAISFPPGQVEQARAAAREIVAELRAAATA